MGTTVAYIVGTGSRWSDNELRLSLRSVAANVRDLDSVLIVGHKPSWVRGVEHIPATDPYKVKDSNIINKVRLACIALKRPFLLSSDDQVLLRKSTLDDIVPTYLAVFDGKKGSYWRNTNIWRTRLYHTLNLYGVGAKHFEPHAMAPIWPDSFLAACDKMQWRDPLRGECILYSWYYNFAEKYAGKTGFYRKHNPEDHIYLRSASDMPLAAGARQAGCSNRSPYPRFLFTFLTGMFKSPCKFESDSGCGLYTPP